MGRRRDVHILPLVYAALSSALLLLAACGAAGAGGGGSSIPGGPQRMTLACTTETSPQGVDVISTLLTCTVTYAPASATSFVLNYHVTGSLDHPHEYTATCAGALHGGSGVCSQRYYAPVPLATGKAVVSGKTEPDQQQLGPVSPREVTPSGAPASTPPGAPANTPIPPLSETPLTGPPPNATPRA
jgi:hypothetical protein